MKTTILYQDTLTSLRECYNTHSMKFSSTRKKQRPEIDYIIDKLLQQPNHSNWLSIVELGCWDWRLFDYIEQRHPTLIRQYRWVDISQNLLDIAQEKTNTSTKDIQRICDDMITYTSLQAQESVDVVVCLASFQHLPDTKSRNLLLHHIYRILYYEGSFVTIDRSRSQRMITKHYKSRQESLTKRVRTLWTRERNNLLIPFTHNGITTPRLYHIFTVYELKKLLAKHWFVNSTSIYSGQNGDFHHNILKARNICTHVQKKVFYTTE